MKTFDFVICMEIMEPILKQILIVSKSLQSPTLDLIEGMTLVGDLRTSLNSLRGNRDTFSVEKCKELNIDVPEVRNRSLSCRIDDQPGTQFVVPTKEDEVLIGTYLPMLDSLRMGLTSN